MFKLIHTSRIHLYLTTDIKQFGFVDNRLGYMMVHEEIYEHLTQNSDKLIEDSKVNYINILNDLGDKSTRLGELYSKFGAIEISFFGEKYSNNPFRNFITGVDSFNERLSAFYSAIKLSNYNDIILSKLKEKSPSDDIILEYIITEFCKFYLFNKNFDRLKRVYTPQLSHGQESEFDLYLELNEAISKHIKQKRKKWEEFE